MAMTTNPPAETTGELELPPSDAVLAQNHKGVSWSTTPKENAQQTIEKRKIPVKYIFLSKLSVKTVLKDTLNMFQKTDPEFLLVSRIDRTVILQTASDVDKFSSDDFPKLFPASVLNGKTFMSMFSVSVMPINRLKRATYGFYAYAGRRIWINEDIFLSNDIRNIGFIIRKDPRKISRDLLKTHLFDELSCLALDANLSHQFHEAQEALPFTAKIPTFVLRNSENVYHSSAAGRVTTNALTIHCDYQHVAFLSQLFIQFYEDGKRDEQFVPHSLLNGSDATNLRAYRNAIVHQNQYLDEVKVLPVIGISPKALKETIQLGDAAPENVLSLLNRYSHFSSIEVTTQSEELGKYLFMTTTEKFEKGKQFIMHSLPLIWAKLENTFLDELPATVRCPRLTTSNLKDKSTMKTAALLSAYKVPDDATIVSQWSKPPSTRRQPPPAVIVNYSEQDFPSMVNTSKNKPKRRQPPNNVNAVPPGQPIDNVSVHSNASATSAGTNFTKEDGLSLFTSLTESFVEDLKSQNAAVIENHKNMMELMKAQSNREVLQREAQQAENAAIRAEQAAQAIKTDERFEQMLQAFMTHSTISKEKSKGNDRKTKEAPQKTTRTRRNRSGSNARPHNRLRHEESQMDTEDNDNQTTDTRHRPMDTTSDGSRHTDPKKTPLPSSSSSSSDDRSSASSETYTKYNHHGRRRSETSNPDTDSDFYKHPTPLPSKTVVTKLAHDDLSLLDKKRFQEYHEDDDNARKYAASNRPPHSDSADNQAGGEGTDDENEWFDDPPPKVAPVVDTDEHPIPTILPDENYSLFCDNRSDIELPEHSAIQQTDEGISSPPRLARRAVPEPQTILQAYFEEQQRNALKQTKRFLADKYDTPERPVDGHRSHAPNSTNSAEWNVVSATKRKAKDSPKPKVNIRKSTDRRSTKKQILSARDFVSEATGQDQ
jgi:hypothetical protein